MADLLALFMSPSASAVISGMWLAWNALFAGVLVPLPSLFVVWKPWAAYVSPFWHVENAWMWATFHNKQTDCGPREIPVACPPTGNMVINSIGYGQISGPCSQLVLLCTLLVYWGVVWVAIQVRHLRAARRRAANAGASPPPPTLGKGDLMEESDSKRSAAEVV
jgi:hypothetical protein